MGRCRGGYSVSPASDSIHISQYVVRDLGILVTVLHTRGITVLVNAP